MSIHALTPAAVMGIGAVTALGCGMDAQRAAFAGQPPDDAARTVDDAALWAATRARAMRRADRFSRMAVAAAQEAHAMAAAACANEADRVGVIVATAFGPHVRTFRFLDGMIDHGDAAALPTDFSHSVHNVAAAYISQQMGLTGGSCSVTRFHLAFTQAVALGQCWLADGTCDRVLVGAVDEVGDVALHVAGRLADASLRPGEGAVFVELCAPRHAWGAPLHVTVASRPTDASLAVFHDVPIAGPVNPPDTAINSGTWFGHTAIGDAFGLLAAWLCMNEATPTPGSAAVLPGRPLSADPLLLLARPARGTLEHPETRGTGP